MQLRAVVRDIFGNVQLPIGSRAVSVAGDDLIFAAGIHHQLKHRRLRQPTLFLQLCDDASQHFWRLARIREPFIRARATNQVVTGISVVGKTLPQLLPNTHRLAAIAPR